MWSNNARHGRDHVRPLRSTIPSTPSLWPSARAERFAKGVAEAIAEAASRITQDVFVSVVGMSDDVREILDKAGIPAFDDCPMAARAAEACASFAGRGQRATLEPCRFSLRPCTEKCTKTRPAAHMDGRGGIA